MFFVPSLSRLLASTTMIAVGLAPRVCLSADPFKMPVEVRATTNDPVGMRLAYQLREQLLASRQFAVADTGTRMVITLITMAPDTRTEDRTIYSASILFNDPGQRIAFVTSYVGVCGTNKVASCAEGLIASLAAESKGAIPMSSN